MDSPIRYNEKSVIIHRDENGFGFRVGGQNPVIVDCVHENGAAWKAGVRKDDRIIKVNGTLVRSYDHQSVVHMIQGCSPFVNLTLHSPGTTGGDQFAVSDISMQSAEPNKNGVGSTIVVNNGSPDINLKAQSLHPRFHNAHHSSSSPKWLQDIGDDLFQDKPQQQQVNADSASGTPTALPHVGVSKLKKNGPNISITNHSQISGNGKPKLRHQRNQSSTRDNPYYYYKTAPEKTSETNSCTSTSSLIGQDQGSIKSSASQSMIRARSSSKMSTRSTTGKYRPRNLRSRLVEDLRSLTITNNQTTPSSLSTSPSSSDLSDCDDQDSSRLDCSSINISNSPTGATNLNSSANANSFVTVTSSQAGGLKPRHTTRRLEIIRELIDTEKTHTERLKHLNDLLYKPIKAEGLVPMEQLKMVFSCHKTLFKIHRQIYKILLAAQQNTSECHQEPLIGRALVEIFEGELGKRLERAASTFCACQSTNTELLNRFTRKDTKVGEFLAQVANQQMLGRLGIKDLLASCFQRLTKYPLLLDNLLKATPTRACGIHSKSLSEGSIATSLATKLVNSSTSDSAHSEHLEPEVTNNSDEKQPAPSSTKTPTISTLTQAETNHDEDKNTSATILEEEYAYERFCISKALHQSRQILIHVNEAVKRAISHNKLREIWKKTDKYPSLPVIDIETQQMLHEGPLTLRLAKRTIEVYVLLLTHYIVILTREGQDKYKLKSFTADGKSPTQFSPIFDINEHLATRDTATDENGFYLLCKNKDDSRIYEFASQSPTERAKWKEKIHMAQLYLCNFAAAPEDDNTLTRYRELISLATSSNTPNNIEPSPTNNNNVSSNNNILPIIHTTTQSSSSLSDVNHYTTGQAPSTTQQIDPDIGHDHNVRAQDV